MSREDRCARSSFRTCLSKIRGDVAGFAPRLRARLGPFFGWGRRDHDDGDIQKRFDAFRFEPFGFEREVQHPAVADRAELVGQQVGCDVVADNALALSPRQY